MRAGQSPSLSKSRFTAGRQCLKRLYLECYHRELMDAVDEPQQARLDAGNRVGELARDYFPGGILLAESRLEHSQAVERTRRLLTDNPVPPLYEAAFEFERIRVRADVLCRNPQGGFDLIEVKSTTRFEYDKHLPDVAIQLYVLEGSGTPIDRAYLMHLNNQYVYPGGAYDLEQLFALENVTDYAHRFIADEVPGNLVAMAAALRPDTPPAVATGPHCVKPYTCPFYGHCHQGETASAAPPGGKPYIHRKLVGELAQLRYPVSYLDFESVGTALPRYAGTRPYQALPFQWSLHIQESPSGRLQHREFLNDADGDPRERVIQSLRAALPPHGSIAVYSGYEKRMLTELARDFPQHAAPLLALVDRLYDLLPVIRRSYKHPALTGYSLKTVLPVLAPGRDYTDLAIQAGNDASLSYLKMVDPATPPGERDELRRNLLAYCQRDTLATVEVVSALQDLVSRN